MSSEPVATAKDALFFQTILCSMKNKPDVRLLYSIPLSQSASPRMIASSREPIPLSLHYTSTLKYIQVDWSIVAQKSGYKDAKTAATRYGQIMKKLTGVSAGRAMSGATSANPDSPVKKTNGTPKKIVGSGTNGNAMKITKSRAPKKRKPESLDSNEEMYEAIINHYERDYGGEYKQEEREETLADLLEGAEC